MFVEQKNLEASTAIIGNQGLSVEVLNLESVSKINENGGISCDGDSERGDDQQRMGMEMKSSQKDRKTKQLNRWMVQWSVSEDETLFEKYIEIGSRWVQLSKYFENKSDNAVKNRFYCCMRKVQRRMHYVQRQKKYKQNKPIGYDSLLTVLEIGKYHTEINDKRFMKIRENENSIMELRQLIIRIARQPQDKIEDLLVMSLIDKYLQLKHSLKFINIQRVKKNVRKSGFQVVSLSKKKSQIQTSPSSPVKFEEFQIMDQRQLKLEQQLKKEVLFEIVDIPEFTVPKIISNYELNSYEDLDVLGLKPQRFNDLFFI